MVEMEELMHLVVYKEEIWRVISNVKENAFGNLVGRPAPEHHWMNTVRLKERLFQG